MKVDPRLAIKIASRGFIFPLSHKASEDKDRTLKTENPSRRTVGTPTKTLGL